MSNDPSGYIAHCLSQGYSKEQIKGQLLRAGWPENIIDQSLQTTQLNQTPSSTIPPVKNKSKNLIIIIILVFLAMGGAGILAYFKYFHKSASDSQSTSTSSTQQSANSDQNALDAKGTVSLSETVCKNPQVATSLSNGEGQGIVGSKGEFTTKISKTNAAVILLIENQNKSCLTAVSLPQNANSLVFDAKSTLMASMFMTPGILTTDPTEAEARMKMIEGLSTYPAAYSYLKENLKTKYLGDLTQTDEYNNLLQSCITEMASRLQAQVGR